MFERNDEVAAGLSKAVITQAISQWLGHRVKIENLQVTNDNATLAVDLIYRILVTDEVRRVRFERGE